jgi:tripartite-type tricarboxylate transporter receptor subunit TctC
MSEALFLTHGLSVSRRRFVQAGLASASAWVMPTTQAEEKSAPFPRRPITLLVPWSAGGGTDLSLRLLAELASQHLGQRVIVDNRPGAGGTMAMNALAQAAPDGHTIAQMPQTVFRAPWVQKLPWDPIRDTTAIVQISGVTFGIVVSNDSTFTSISDVLAWARAHPGELTVATNGVGTTPHVVLDGWFEKLGLSYIHVPYKGVSEQMLAVASAQVMVGISANGFAPYVDNARARLLALMSAKRSPRWPQVPTLKELGHGIVANSPYGLAGPKGMPTDIVQVLHDAFKLAMHEPRHLAELARYDQELAYLNSAAYAQSMRSLYAQEQKTAERLGLVLHKNP